MTATIPALPATSHAVQRAWLTVMLLMPVALLNYLDRQMLASMQTSVMASIASLGEAANREELWGIMLGQFKWVYAVFSLLGGYMADRFSKRLAICGSLFVWSAITFLTGHVTTYKELLWARSLMGISEAFYIPAALALITDYHTGSTRSRAVGMHQLAIYLGVILGGFGGYAATDPHLGWRFAFSACGVFGMIYALPLVALLRDVPVSPNRTTSQSADNNIRAEVGDKVAAALRDGGAVARGNRHLRHGVSELQDAGTSFADRPTSPTSPLRAAAELLGNSSYLLLVLYFTLPAIAGWVVRDWMPSILKSRFDVGEGQAGVAATLYWQVAAIVGVIVGGWLADRWMSFSPRGRIYLSAIGMGLIVPAIFGVGNAGSLWSAVMFLILFGLGWGFFDCNNMPILSQIVRPELRATGYGVMNFVSISVGGLGDWGFGILRDREVPLNVTFGGFAGLAAVSAVLVLLIRPNPQFTMQEQSK